MTASAVARSRHREAVAVRRLVNSHIAEVGARMDADQETQVYEFMCECGDPCCRKAVRFTQPSSPTVPGWVRAHDLLPASTVTGNGDVNLALTPNSATARSIASREDTDPTHQPQLIITTS